MKLLVATALIATLISSSNILGTSFAQSKTGTPSIGQSEQLEVNPDFESENSSTVANQGSSQNRFCIEGTGGFGRTCIPCDPAKPTPGMNTECKLTMFPETGSMSTLEDDSIDVSKPVSESPKSMLNYLENEGELPKGTVEALNSLGRSEPNSLFQLCNTLSKSSDGDKPDCGEFEGQDGTVGTAEFLAWIADKIIGAAAVMAYDELKKDVLKDDPRKVVCEPTPGYEDTGIICHLE